ncbi:MAG: helix-turn-helix domain-containing protein [Clostridia bacterium]|jgi:excisionase family DNA binding protein|nr:helix-turn-helix domain-containing protein [Clostridia bacterium]
MENTEKTLIYTVPDMAKKLKISKSMAYALARTKGFPKIKIGKRILIPAKELEEWLESKCNDI